MPISTWQGGKHFREDYGAILTAVTRVKCCSNQLPLCEPSSPGRPVFPVPDHAVLASASTLVHTVPSPEVQARCSQPDPPTLPSLKGLAKAHLLSETSPDPRPQGAQQLQNHLLAIRLITTNVIYYAQERGWHSIYIVLILQMILQGRKALSL